MTFGSYEQDNNNRNGTEDIQWFVLEKTDDQLLLISCYCLESLAYHSHNTNITWEECDLRKWLNDQFLNTAFNTTEQKIILETTVSAEQNPKYGTTAGRNTRDKVFLLSIQEVRKYSEKNAKWLKCQATDYVDNNKYRGNTDWWLRSPGNNAHHAAYVGDDGDIESYGISVNQFSKRNGFGVRPVLWIDIEP